MIIGTQEWTEAKQGIRAFAVLYAIESGYECEHCNLTFAEDEVEIGEDEETNEPLRFCPICAQSSLVPIEIVVIDGEALSLPEADDDLRAGRRG